MKLTYNGLKRFLPQWDATPEAVADCLPILGLEVESFTRLGLPPLPRVVVGLIEAKAPHPNAERLTVCQVRVDAHAEPLSIVCGAKNHEAGHYVPVALEGAVLPGGLKIKASKLRGVLSCGMLCSESELGLSKDSDGLLILNDLHKLPFAPSMAGQAGQNPNDTWAKALIPGTPINAVFGACDYVFEIAVTANRSDALGHRGVARELAAYYKVPFVPPVLPDLPNLGTNGWQVQLEAGTACPWYTAWVVEGLKVGPSPRWLQDELLALGLKPINNVVDITNWVMYQTGQPLHAFDADCLDGNSLTVRWAHPNEKLHTLDGATHTLGPTHLVIADRHQALALAGVMGGQAAQVCATTQRIVLESAYFQPATIRASSRSLGLATDSAYRFARDVDPAGVLLGAQQALALLADCAGGHCTAQFAAGAPLPDREPITLQPSYISQCLGFQVPTPVLRDHLERLGFGICEVAAPASPADPGQDAPGASVLWQVKVPSHKRDVHRSIDLVEECLRMLGTQHIPDAPVTLSLPQLPGANSPELGYLERASTYLQDQHAAECYHPSLQSQNDLQAWLGDSANPATLQALALHNPLTAEHTHLRSSLLPGLIRAWGYNQDHGNTQRRYFETGRVFIPTAQGVQETISVAWLIQAQAQERSWMPGPSVDFFKAQSLMIGLLRLLLGSCTLPPTLPLQGHTAFAPSHSARWADLMEQGFEGRLGFLSLSKMRSYAVRTPLILGELLIRPDYWEAQPRITPMFRPYSVYPCIRKDLSLLVPCDTLAGTVAQDLHDCARQTLKDSHETLESIKIFDCFQSENLPKGKKSLTFELLFRAQDRTLSDTEVNSYLQSLHHCILNHTPYHIRSV